MAYSTGTNLTFVQFYILAILADEPSHGYALQDELVGLTVGRLIATQTIYKSLKLMLAKGWVERLPERLTPASRRTSRTAYRLTPAGLLREASMRALKHLR